MHELVQNAINGASLGSTYALLALGLALVYSIMGLINFAHGELFTIGGYTMWWTLKHGVPWPLVLVITPLVCAVAAMLMERVAFRPLRGAGLVTLLITSFAVSYFLQTVFQIGISAAPEGIELPGWVNNTVHVGSYTIASVKLVTTGVTLIALAALTLFLRRTLLGVSMRAAAEDFQTVRLMGVKANRVVALAFGLSGGLAGIAALLFFATTAAVDPPTGTPLVINAFIAVILGGLGSLSGAVLGGFVLGFAEVLFEARLPGSSAQFANAFVLLVLIGLLLLRPQGLLGRAAARES
jgi:branched-chain amino acid transport system permease protein